MVHLFDILVSNNGSLFSCFLFITILLYFPFSLSTNFGIVLLFFFFLGGGGGKYSDTL